MDIFISVLFITFATAQVLDCYTTYHILKRGGAELNPVMRKLMEWWGVLPTLLSVKIPLTVLVFIAVLNYYIWEALVVINILYGIVLWNNFSVLGKQK